jgi:penicillin-binding protein 1A
MENRRRPIRRTLWIDFDALDDEADEPPPPRRRWWRWLLLAGMTIAGCIVLSGAIAAFLLYRELTKDLPQPGELGQYQTSLVTKVYASDGELIADFFVEKRFLVPLDEIPLYVRQATVAVEDGRFYTHPGIDLWGVLRAAWVNYRAGEVKEGASTITQQVARMLFLNRDRTFSRKFRESILAYRIEHQFSKDQILEMYLNNIFYGHNIYGIEAAAQVYFGKPARELTLAEGALISGLPRAPNRYSPFKDLKLGIQRRNHVLRRMVEEGYIKAEQEQEAVQQPVQIHTPTPQAKKGPYFVEYVRQYLEERYGATALYRGGFQVYTTLDLRLQQAAEQALQRGLLVLDKRHGYTTPKQRLALTGNAATDTPRIEAVTRPADGNMSLRVGEVVPGVVLKVGPTEALVAVKDGRGIIRREGYAWARAADLQQDYEERRALSPRELVQRGDVIQVRLEQIDPAGKAHGLVLEQEPAVQGALLTMEVGTGYVLAMVGGYDFAKSQFNRAVQALRQPGSAFKPVIYAAAIETGMTPASVIVDAPLVIEVKGQEAWRPENYSQRFYGPTTLRTALVQSRNVVTVKLLEKIGVMKAVACARRLGITSPLAPYLSLALGSSDVTLVELTTAYGVFANSGMHVPPIFITKIVDAQGRAIEEHLPEAQRVIDADVAYVITSMLEDVIQRGTGRTVQALGRPVAGKTGTTNDFRDAWFLGYTPELITGVWVGKDDRGTLGRTETGGRAASPIWLEFMQEAMRGYPLTDFAIPPGVRFVRAEADKGISAKAWAATASHFEVLVDAVKPAPPSSDGDVRRRMRMLDQAAPSTAGSAGAVAPADKNAASDEEAAPGTRSSPALLTPSDQQRQLRQLDRRQSAVPPARAEDPTDTRRESARGVN